MEFINLTRNVEIGANCYALKASGKCFLLDAGMHPTRTGTEAQPNFAAVAGISFDGAILTHAHQDHVGSLPVFTQTAPETPVFMTAATSSIAEIMLHNSVNVMLRQRDEMNLVAEGYPLFTHRGADLCEKQWRICPVNHPVSFDGERISRKEAEQGEPYFELFDAGHILGSTGVLLSAEGKTFFYTGDVNFDDQTLLKGALFPQEPPDILLLESTRGDAPVPEGFTRAAEEKRFAKALTEAIQSKGILLIPVFALGKTQEILGMLWKFRQEGLIPQLPIYIGGLSAKITGIYDDFRNNCHRHYPELRLFEEMSPYVLAGSDAASHPLRNEGIYLLSSGMMTENTLSNIFARQVLPDPDSSIFFVGYSDPESPAGRVRAAKDGEGVSLNSKLPPVTRRCRVEAFQFSAHSSRESLLSYATQLKPKKILLTHGDPLAVEWMKASLAKALPGTEAIIPEPGKWLTL
ncbi:MAG: MBL fold metallo-hydrolase [Chthoniobacterales bacterium]